MGTETMDNPKKIFWLGTLTYSVLLAFSVLLFKERTVFLDISFHLYEILRTGEYAIQNYRFGSVFTQSFPLFASQLGLPLKAVMVAYSAGFVLYYFSIFFICAKILKQHRYALLMLLLSIFMVADTFYWIQSELPQGLAFWVLTMAYIDSQKEFRIASWQAALLVPLLVTVAFFHPLLAIPFVFFVGYQMFVKKAAERKIWWVALAVFVVILILKSLFFRTPYDSQSMGGLANFIRLFPDYFSIQSNRNFLSYLVEDYYLILPALALIAWYYISKKSYWKLLWSFSFFFGYLALVNISYPQGDEQFYMENLYLPLGVFLLVPLVFEIVPSFSKKMVFPILLGVVCLRLFHVFMEHREYTTRLDWYRDLMEQTENSSEKKIVLDQAEVPSDTLMMTWGSSYECWLLSTIETGETRSIVIHDKPSDIAWAMPQKDGLLTNWGIYPYGELPAKYFIFTDSTSYVFYKK